MQYLVDYPDRQLDRFSSFFRLLFVIPIVVVLGLLANGAGDYEGEWYIQFWFAGAGAGVLFGAPLLMIVFRQKYPRWWYDWNVNVTKFGYRVESYLLLLRDEYPATDEDQAVHLELPYPDVESDLNRYLPLVKWLLAIQHYIVLFFLVIGLVVVVIFAWFAILFTRRYLRSLFDYVVGVQRWSIRVEAYALVLTTDQYPPFRLEP